MPGTSLLVLLDDIASVLDDVATMSKVAVKKTAGVLGDDLAVNAEQVTGVRADRELPVVWAVAKGSFRNKLILVPAALVVSFVVPWLIAPVLMLGGLFLCYEGFEKLAHKFLSDAAADAAHHAAHVSHLAAPNADRVAFERNKIKGAVRTDFILSLEIIVLTLGVVADAHVATRVVVVGGIALLMTVGVYGLVAGIVKLDDAGVYLVNREGTGTRAACLRWFGARLLDVAPWLMKALSVVGTAAMFMVGGGIVVHGIHPLHVFSERLAHQVEAIGVIGPMLSAITPTLLAVVVGIGSGAAVLAVVTHCSRLHHNWRVARS